VYYVPHGTEVIWRSAFEYSKTVKTVVLPDTIRKIRPRAFAFSSVENVFMPEGLEEIHDAAFYSAGNLGETYIPATVSYIASTAFYQCTISQMFRAHTVKDSYAYEFAHWSSQQPIQVPLRDKAVFDALLEIGPSTLPALAEELYQMTRAERMAAGLNPTLGLNTLEAAAKARAWELTVSCSDERPDGRHFSTTYDEHRTDYDLLAENRAFGFTTPAEVLDYWMSSPEHRSNLLNPEYEYSTVAAAVDKDGQLYWVQSFMTYKRVR